MPRKPKIIDAPVNFPNTRVEREKQQKLKRDGTPLTPWSEEVALRLKVKEARTLANGGIDPHTEGQRLCTGHTTGVHGPRRPCGKVAMHGLTVCYSHGGGTKAAKESARRRLAEELGPTISRLVEIRDQDMHMPSALGASVQIMNRVLGKADSVEKDKHGGLVINIGLGLGGLPIKPGQVKVLASTTGQSDEAIDAEFTPENDE